MAVIEDRATARRGISYRARVRLAGFEPISATFTKRSEAKEWALQIEADMKAGRYQHDLLARSKTASDLISRYLDHVLPVKTMKLRSRGITEKHLIWWRSQLGDTLLANITPQLLSECKDRLAGKHYSLRAPATVNRYVSSLSHVFSVAIKEWGWIHTNPCVKVEKAKEPKGRVRFLSRDELQRLLKICIGCPQPIYFLVCLALATGARRNELLTIRLSNIDLSRGVISLMETKNDERRPLYVSGELLDQMCRHIERHSRGGWLFANRTGSAPWNPEKTWKHCLSRAGIADFRFHDLRHTHASYLAMHGADPATIARSLGHKDINMVNRYTHLATSHVANTVTNMANNLLTGVLQNDNR